MLAHRRPTPQKPSRLVILGSGGFVGGAIAKLAEKELVETLRIGSKDIDLIDDHAAAKLEKLLKPDDCIIFAAAIDLGHASSSESLIKNVRMAQHVAAALRQIKPAHLIYLSSDAVYAPGASLIAEETPAAPATLYGAMHRARELLLQTETDMPLAVLRLTAIYGATDTHNAYGPNRLMREALKKKTITLFGQGEEMRDHLYVEDAARLILAAASRHSTGSLNLASGSAISFAALAHIIAAETGARIEHAPRTTPVTHKHHNVTARLIAFPSLLPRPLEIGTRESIAAMR